MHEKIGRGCRAQALDSEGVFWYLIRPFSVWIRPLTDCLTGKERKKEKNYA